MSKKTKITDYTQDPANPNQHSERGTRMLDDSLASVGLGRSIVVDKNGYVIAGNSTQERAVDRGFEDAIEIETDGSQLVVVRRTDLDLLNDDGRGRALSYYDNRSAETGISWSPEQVLADMQAGSLPDGLWYEDELSDLLADLMPDEPQDAPDAQIDRAAELNEVWQVKRGDLWRIPSAHGGEHRLLCGDCTIKIEIDESQCLIFDPEWDAVIPDMPSTNVIAFTDGQRFADIIRRYGAPIWVFTWDCVTSWYTPNRPLKRCKYALWYGSIEHYKFDGAHYGEPDIEKLVSNTRGSYVYKPDTRGKHLSDLFCSAITRLHAEGHHAHEKPVDWVRMLIGNCFPNVRVYDPFAGSGTTLVACEQLGRLCDMVEIKEIYCAVILQRSMDMGLTPERVENITSHDITKS